MARHYDDYVFEPEEAKKHHGLGILVLILVLLAALASSCYFYNRALNEQIALDTEYVRVMSLNSAFEGFRILHISDLSASSLGSDYTKWKNLLSGQKWNAVVMSGDMVGASGNSEPLLSLIHILLNLNPDAPVYFVAGDGDPEPVVASARATTEVFADWVIEAQKAGAIYLDAPVAQEQGKYKVWFTPAYLYDMDIRNSADSLRVQIKSMESQGAQYEVEGGANYRAMVYRLDAMDRALTAISEMSENDLQIAVNHIPLETDYIRSAVSYANTQSVFNFRAVDLVLCGHLCGGQYCLPELGPIYVEGLGFFPGKEQVQGMMRINSVNMYVSSGISSASTAPIAFRLFNRPSVTILRFTGTIE